MCENFIIFSVDITRNVLCIRDILSRNDIFYIIPIGAIGAIGPIVSWSQDV